MGDTNIIARVPKIKDRDTIDIIARFLDNKDRDSVSIAIVGDSADVNIVARNLDIEDRDSVAIAIIGNSTIIIAFVGDITNNADQRANVANTGPRANVIATNEPTIDAQQRASSPSASSPVPT